MLMYEDEFGYTYFWYEEDGYIVNDFFDTQDEWMRGYVRYETFDEVRRIFMSEGDIILIDETGE